MDLRTLTDRLKLSSADLRTVVMDATFQALEDATANDDEDQPVITLDHLRQAINQLYHRQGKPAPLEE
jgi:hypothetical protein